MSKPQQEVLIEIQQVGSGLEVRAVDTADGLEVIFIAPVSASRSQIEDLAIAKLGYVRRKSSGDNGNGGGTGGPAGTGGGILA